MASLGELTAGVAHEMQNPLNFVNNFSEVSIELMDEMKTEIENGNRENALAVANEIRQNLEKIIHHGKSADGVVKGMLLHSRKSLGAKELADINALADEYLRLSYFSLRAKDKSFHATMKTDFDKSLSADSSGIGKVNVYPQELGRVILNLINNAFYAVRVKMKKNIPGYVPTVSVTTKRVGEEVEIVVRDNGTGIPSSALSKIFQPFFTTKPTGEGTGLGLSLSYDIVTKVHGGELTVETEEGEFTAFTVRIPV
jgi:signal transduction histidine kinase